MENRKFENRNYFEDNQTGQEDIDMNKCFDIIDKDFDKFNTYEDRLEFLKKRNMKIFDEIKKHDPSIDVRKMEEYINKGQLMQ